MFQTQYATPPPFYNAHDYRTPPHTPAGGNYYSPRQYVYTATPSPKGHTRRNTGDASYTYTYTTPKKTAYYSGPEYSSPGYYNSAQTTPQRRSDYVSDSDRKRESARYYRVPADGDGKRQRRYSESKQYHTRSRYVYDDVEHEYEYLPRYEEYPRRTPPPPYQRHQSYRESRADHRYYDQVPIYTRADDSAKRRPRTASYATKPTNLPPRPRPSTATKPPPQATDDDARRAGIPAGYSFKNWDPREEPILLLGSVFDANSLGKWIYDWTVFRYGPATPMSEVAGELWLLLIQLAGKVKRAEDTLPRVRQDKSRDLVDDFLESGERLWQRFNKLLKICENYMWKAAKKESRDTKNITMGKNSGCEFVDAIFGRERELERTEKLMTGIRLWSLRFDANVTPVLENPTA